MLAVKSMDVRENFKTLCDKVFQGETLIISRPKNENVVMLSEKEYNQMPSYLPGTKPHYRTHPCGQARCA